MINRACAICAPPQRPTPRLSPWRTSQLGFEIRLGPQMAIGRGRGRLGDAHRVPTGPRWTLRCGCASSSHACHCCRCRSNRRCPPPPRPLRCCRSHCPRRSPPPCASCWPLRYLRRGPPSHLRGHRLPRRRCRRCCHPRTCQWQCATSLSVGPTARPLAGGHSTRRAHVGQAPVRIVVCVFRWGASG